MAALLAPPAFFLACVIFATADHDMRIRVSIPRPGAVVGGSIFILVVDDDAAFADAAARSFESVGMRTVVAMGSTAAIDGFDRSAIDVVVTDIKLPEGEPRGSVLARMIKNKRPHVPIILMTAHPELLKKDVPPPGATLCKPLEIAELCRAIKVRLAQ
jgi:two-component system, cell cycle sensor histidine kinase and response regulator CckA